MLDYVILLQYFFLYFVLILSVPDFYDFKLMQLNSLYDMYMIAI